jgi:micrococcal nuclease
MKRLLIARQWLFALILVGLTAVLPVTVGADHDPPRGIPHDAESATVRAIVDGDTMRVTLEDGTRDTVRLIGIDTPETRDPGSPVECYGQEASDRTARLLPIGREVWLERDVSERDRFDRLLRYVWVEKNDGDEYMVNEVMVRDGFAIAKRYTPDTARAERLERAQERAITAGRGLWTACPDFVTSLTPTAVAPTPVPQPTEPSLVPVPTEPPAQGNCDPSYPTLCIPIGAADLDCGDISARRFPVYQPDLHRFDGDYDGIGCESG